MCESEKRKGESKQGERERKKREKKEKRDIFLIKTGTMHYLHLHAKI